MIKRGTRLPHSGRRYAATPFAGLFFALFAGASTPAVAQDWIIGEASAAVPPSNSPLLEEPVVEASKQDFNIPSQPLVNALDAFSSETGILLFYSSRLTASHNSPGVSGSFTPTEALRALLVGTGLSPLETDPGAITLVLNAPDTSVTFATVSPIKAPSLTLSTLHVEAPPVRNYRLYSTSVQYAILGALQRDAVIRASTYRADINVWVTPAGTVKQSQMAAYSGDTGLDAAITQIVRRVVILQTPPSDLPQPVHVRIEGNGAQ